MDWWDASLTDEELERALLLLDEWEELAQPLGKLSFWLQLIYIKHSPRTQQCGLESTLSHCLSAVVSAFER